MNRYESDSPLTGLGTAARRRCAGRRDLRLLVGGAAMIDTLITIALIAAGIVFAWFLLNALAAPMLSSKLSRLEEQRDREQGPRT